MSFEYLVGLRYLSSRKGNFLVSIITIISVVGVALGVTALLVVLSVLSGFESDFRDKIIGNNAHLIVVEAGQRYMNQRDDIIQSIREYPMVKEASPFLFAEVLVQGKSGRSAGVLLNGIDPKSIGDVTSIAEDMIVGDIMNLQSGDDLPGIIVGAETANHALFLLPGDTVDVISPSGEISPFGLGPKIRRFRVAGIFKSGLYEYDARTAYIDLATAQRFFGLDNKVSGIQVSLNDMRQTVKAASGVQDKLGEDFIVRTWMELNRDLFSAFKLEKTVFFIVLTMIILVAAFNIVGTLILVVTEKSREVAILKALGAGRAAISRIFVSTGFVIGLIGTSLGLVSAYGIIIALRDHFQFPLNPNVYQISQLPVSIRLSDFALVAGAALFITFVSTLYPSIKASKLKPVEGLRYE